MVPAEKKYYWLRSSRDIPNPAAIDSHAYDQACDLGKKSLKSRRLPFVPFNDIDPELTNPLNLGSDRPNLLYLDNFPTLPSGLYVNPEISYPKLLRTIEGGTVPGTVIFFEENGAIRKKDQEILVPLWFCWAFADLAQLSAHTYYQDRKQLSARQDFFPQGVAAGLIWLAQRRMSGHGPFPHIEQLDRLINVTNMGALEEISDTRKLTVQEIREKYLAGHTFVIPSRVEYHLLAQFNETGTKFNISKL